MRQAVGRIGFVDRQFAMAEEAEKADGMSAADDSGSGVDTVRLRIQVQGKVQGVFFRAKAQEEAERLGVSGLARNEPDGTVTIECEGSPEAVERLRAWCENGPPQARVERIETVPLAPTGDTGFRAR